jgi:hypothetical protein
MLTIPKGATAATPATLGTLAQAIDRLAEVRATLKALTDEEGTLKAQVMTVMHATGLATVRTETHVATLGAREVLTVCPYRLYERLGPLALDAMTVHLTAARHLLGETELGALGTRESTPVLRVGRR